jgi:hypothetical protein
MRAAGEPWHQGNEVTFDLGQQQKGGIVGLDIGVENE